MRERPVLAYMVATGLSLAVIVAGFALLGDPETRRGVALAAGLAWPVQVALFAARERRRGSGTGFLAMWMLGTMVRLAVVGVGAWIVWGKPELALPLLLGLAGFLLLMLILEAPIMLRSDGVRLERGSR